MKIYNKLVRDRIPEIIENSGKKVNYRVLSEEEYKQSLKDKLLEEVNEVWKSNTREELIEELADVIEVIYSLIDVYDIKLSEVLTKRMEKQIQKGGFAKKYFLEEVSDD